MMRRRVEPAPLAFSEQCAGETRRTIVFKKMVGGTGIEPVAPTMSRSSKNAQINIFQILKRAYEDRRVRTKMEQNRIYRQVSAKSVVANA